MTGKLSKKDLREQYHDYRFAGVEVAGGEIMEKRKLVAILVA
jgi:hypothetical protein